MKINVNGTEATTLGENEAALIFRANGDVEALVRGNPDDEGGPAAENMVLCAAMLGTPNLRRMVELNVEETWNEDEAGDGYSNEAGAGGGAA